MICTGDLTQLLWAILDNPDDDAPRLIYADRLDELEGDEHGIPSITDLVEMLVKQIELEAESERFE